MSENIKEIMDTYAKLCKTIKTKKQILNNKTIEFESTLDKTKFRSPDDELKRAIFAKKIKPLQDEIEKQKCQRRVMEMKYSFSVDLKSLFEELSRITKKNGNKLILDVETIDYPWAANPRDITPSKLCQYVRCDSFKGDFDVIMYNKTSSFYFRKTLGFTKYLKFSDGGTIKDNTMIDYSSLPFKIKFMDPGKIMVPFSLQDLFTVNDAYDIKKVQKAVVKCYEKQNPTM